MEARPTFGVLVLGLLSLGVSVVVALTPRLWFVDQVALHVALDTTVALAAGFAALLVLGRLRAQPALDTLVLLAALLVLAGGTLVYAAIPAAIAGGKSLFFGIWAPLATGTTGAALVAVAGVLPAKAPRRRNASGTALRLALGVLVLAPALVEALRPILPAAIPPQVQARNPDPFVASSLVLAAQLLGAACWAVTAGAFAQKAERSRDPLAAWVAGGCVFLTFAKLQYLVFPSAYPHWFYLGDLFRLGGYAMLTVGGVRELLAVWRRLADVAVLEERRRLARDLHDGLAQELAFICAEADGELAAASQRALDESRRAIAALTRHDDEPVGRAVAQAAEEVAARHGLQVDVAVDEAVEATPDVREQLVRIAREAVTNAARHAGSDRVRVELTGADGLRLRVEDDGRGFDPDSPQQGHGLVSMRERAGALGASLSISSRRDSGTVVEVVLA